MTQHQHKEEKQLEAIRNRIETGKTKKIQAETRIGSLKEQYKRTAQDLKQLGIEPNEAANKIKEMEQEIQAELEAIQSLLPAE